MKKWFPTPDTPERAVRACRQSGSLLIGLAGLLSIGVIGTEQWLALPELVLLALCG